MFSPVLEAGTIIVNSGAVLKGSGNIIGDLTVNSGGTVSPSPSCLSVLDANFSPGSELQFTVAGNEACTNQSQLIVNGEIDLNDANLNVITDNYNLQVLDEYIFINNDASEAILSPFLDVGENSTYPLDDELLYASYSSGDGNDFSLLFKFIYPIGGTVSGLATGNEVFLQDISGEITSISSNGSYQFPTELDDGSAYEVSVINQPSTPNQTCTVSNGSGNVSGAAVSNIDVICVTNTYAIGGAVLGLAAGNQMTVLNNSGDALVLNSNGGFVFPTPISDETMYNVQISVNPTSPNQTCLVINGSGVVAGSQVSDVVISCETNTYSVSGNIIGLADGNSVVLQNNASDDLTLSADGSFSFATEVADEAMYAVTVLVQPSMPNQTCLVTQGSGQIAGADVINVSVVCNTDMYFVGGDVSGLASGNSLALQNNSSDDLQVSSNGVFVFDTPLDDKTEFDVTVANQPTSPNQTCEVNNGLGTITGDDVVDILVACEVNTYSVGGTVSGLLAGEVLVLQNNASDDLLVFGNGTFNFKTQLEDLSDYAVSVLSEPASPIQNCEISNGKGQVNGASVNDIMVNCDSFDLIFKNGFEDEHLY